MVDPNPGPSLLCEGRPTYGFIRSERVGRRRQEGPILRKRGAVRPTPRILASRKPASLARPGSARTRCREGEAKEREGSGVGQELGTLPPGARAYGRRQYVTLDATSRQEAEAELANVLADVRRGIWQEPRPTSVVEARKEPDFHTFASEYVANRRAELRPRSVEALEWALSNHLLPVFRQYRLAAITVEEIDRYRVAKVREREQGIVERPLSNGSINKPIAVLARVLDQAVEYGWLGTNPARGKRRRLKAEKPRRTWLELDEVRAILDAAGEHRPLLATMILAGLRVGEACALRWRDVDLARGRLHIAEAKTSAGGPGRRPVTGSARRAQGLQGPHPKHVPGRSRLRYPAGHNTRPQQRADPGSR